MINQNLLRSCGYSTDDAKNIMLKLISIGVSIKSTKTIIRYCRSGKIVESIVWMQSARLSSAIKALSMYLSKKPYSRRVKVDKWLDVMEKLKMIQEGLK